MFCVCLFNIYIYIYCYYEWRLIPDLFEVREPQQQASNLALALTASAWLTSKRPGRTHPSARSSTRCGLITFDVYAFVILLLFCLLFVQQQASSTMLSRQGIEKVEQRRLGPRKEHVCNHDAPGKIIVNLLTC